MKHLARALSAVHGASFALLAYVGTVCLERHAWTYTAAFCTAAALAAVAGCCDPSALSNGRTREGTTETDEAVLAETCTCDLWWTSCGTEHDTWCPNYTRSSSS